MFHRRIDAPPGLFLVLLLLVASPLAASTVVYDRSIWEADNPLFTNIDFESSLPGTHNSGLTVGEVEFHGLTGSTENLWVVDPVPYPDYNFGSGFVVQGPAFFSGSMSREIQITLPTGITTFGIDLMNVNSGPATYTVALSTGEQWSGITTLPSPGRAFFGVTSDVSISTAHIIISSGISTTTYPVIDNVSYGVTGAGGPGPEETPEAATMLLVGTGLIFLCRFRRRNTVPVSV
jgi:hypothetical protein